MKHKILAYVFIVFVLAATVSVLYYQKVSEGTPESVVLPAHKDWQTYSGTDFEIQYAKQYVLDNLEPNSVQIAMPEGSFPGTNFVEGNLVVSENASIKTASGCKIGSDGASQINGISFNTSEKTEPAAGSIYDTKTYKVFHARTCFDVTLTLHKGNIANYEPGTVEEVNSGEVWSKLIQVLNTFKFKEQESKKDIGTLKGHVDIGPACPVERPGQPCTISGDVYTYTKIVVYKGNVAVIASTNLNSSGDYSFSLPAGSYSVGYESTVGLPGNHPVPQYVTIRAGETTTLNFSIDTGIR